VTSERVRAAGTPEATKHDFATGKAECTPSGSVHMFVGRMVSAIGSRSSSARAFTSAGQGSTGSSVTIAPVRDWAPRLRILVRNGQIHAPVVAG
jgi:hypothetical protein